MTSAIDLNPNHLDLVERILAEHVPGCEVRAFGSRAAWTARDYSDVDLAVVGDGPLHWRTLSRLREAFEESRLPMRVDVLDWHAISEGFREAIKSDCVVVQEAATPPRWRKETFGDCAVLVRETVSPVDFVDAPYIGLEHIGEGTLSLIGTGVAADVSSAKSRFTSDNILFGKLRPYFRKVVRARFDGICSTDIWVVRPKDGVDAGFLFYVMASEAFVDAATRGSEGTKMPRAKWDFVSRYEFPLPPMNEQRAIARVLGALDDRIELNRRTSETLEEMARALFRSWFVDFDPVRAKAEGRPSGLPPHLDALFPASFEASELGEIPAGWAVLPAGDTMSVYGGSTPSTNEPHYWGGPHCFATCKDLSLLDEPVLATTARRLTDSGVARIRSGLLPAGTVLLSSRAPIGYLAITQTPVAINQGIVAMVCDGPVGAAYALHWTRSNMYAIEARAGGTTFAEISKSSFREIPVLVPPKALHDAWDSMAASLHDLVGSNARQSRCLAEERDALLPWLMSGAVRVAVADWSRAK